MDKSEESVVKEAKSDPELTARIVRQLEFYFGDYNLPRDKFMLRVLADNEDWFPLETLLTFKRLRQLTSSAPVVAAAILDSALLELDASEKRVRRVVPLPKWDEERRREIDARTLSIVGFDPEQTSVDELLQFFGKYKAEHVHRKLRKNNQNEENERNRFTGVVFVTFATTSEAASFLDTCKNKGILFGERILKAKWRCEVENYASAETNDKFDASKIDRTVHVRGFDCLDTSDDELATFFGQFEGSVDVQRRVVRNRAGAPWRFLGSVFVTFEDRQSAAKFLWDAREDGLQYHNGDRLKAEWQEDFYRHKGKFSKERSLKPSSDIL